MLSIVLVTVIILSAVALCWAVMGWVELRWVILIWVTNENRVTSKYFRIILYLRAKPGCAQLKKTEMNKHFGLFCPLTTNEFDRNSLMLLQSCKPFFWFYKFFIIHIQPVTQL